LIINHGCISNEDSWVWLTLNWGITGNSPGNHGLESAKDIKYMGRRQERMGIELTKSGGFVQEFTV
jgi:hypothetical protein